MTANVSVMTRYAAFGPGMTRALATCTDWLVPAELNELARLRDEDRRVQWTVGRQVAKRMICAAVPGSRMSTVEILTRANGLGCRPQVRVGGDMMDASLSISHSSRGVFVGFVASDEISVGVDLAAEVPHDDRFRQLWFTRDERRWLAEEPAVRTSVLWALKEAVFKAGNVGEAWSPRKVEILPRADRNYEVTLFGHPLSLWSVDLRAIDGHLAATVCLPRTPSTPTHLVDVSTCS